MVSNVIVALSLRPGLISQIGGIQLHVCHRAHVSIADASTGHGVSGATVAWDPPDNAVNGDISRSLFAKKWSSTSDQAGRVTLFASEGIHLRWKVEAVGYQPSRVESSWPGTVVKTFQLPEVLLRPSLELKVKVAGVESLGRGTLTVDLAEAAAPSAQLSVRQTRTLIAGETRFINLTEGWKRALLRRANGRLICYEDFFLSKGVAEVVLAPVERRIFGTVARNGTAVTGAVVRVRDQHDPSVVLAESQRTDDSGAYELRVNQAGHLFLVAYPPSSGGSVAYSQSKDIDMAGDARETQVDFDCPGGSVSVNVSDAESGAPIAGALVRAQIQFDSGGPISEQAVTDGNGQLTFEDLSGGDALLKISAAGYRSTTANAVIETEGPPVLVALTPAAPVEGTVVGPDNQPVPGVRIEGGYDDPFLGGPSFVTVTDETGAFELKSVPPLGIPVYFTAPGFALTISFLSAGSQNVVSLSYPEPAMVYLTKPAGSPLVSFRMGAGPANGMPIPSSVLTDLAESNGITPHSLLATQVDGRSILSSFLGPGAFDFYVAVNRKPSDPRVFPIFYQRVGTVTIPSSGSIVLTYQPPAP